ncbi:SRPBCC domain-containing protein [Oscillochloris sp. ZM17-4]|uniref:SRPBCC domain-containing protein n=1 Tax=Oscillochloris sp. ZM17-4 TaxID=2866714 RepID=UPI001C738B72|nr:SRPBCC domain-containing protein [Oscillochloris sp. ZM17-4]MBX0326440.1 SRPBCC domain-containing protein [Oscillochloris sp. ZM17-4]
MMKTYSATIMIDAPVETIWAILTDAAGYPSWDPWAVKIEGVIAAGATITAYTKLSPRAFPVKISEFVPERLMIWKGGMPLGLFTGVRRFTLTPKADGAVEFTIGEVFSGPLLPLFAGSLPDMTQPFADFAAGLKARAEDS